MRMLLVFVSLSLAACQTAYDESAEPVAVSHLAPADPAALMDTWLNAHHDNNHEALAALYEPDGKHSTNTTFNGRDEIAAMFERSVAVSDNFTLTDRQFVMQGDFAFETGVATQDGQMPDGTQLRIKGSYVALMARQPDGGWLIRHLVGGNTVITPLD